jgi:hypothetical protein
MGYCMAIDYDIRASVSPHPPQDGRWAIFVPASYKNMALGEAELAFTRARHCFLATAATSASGPGLWPAACAVMELNINTAVAYI